MRGKSQMYCFYCFMLCAMNCNCENASKKIKLFLCFMSIKDCQIVIKYCWSRCIPQDACLIYSESKFSSSGPQLKTYFFTIISSKKCVFRSEQWPLNWIFVVPKISSLKAISTQSFMPMCVTLELQWDCPHCAK